LLLLRFCFCEYVSKPDLHLFTKSFLHVERFIRDARLAHQLVKICKRRYPINVTVLQQRIDQHEFEACVFYAVVLPTQAVPKMCRDRYFSIPSAERAFPRGDAVEHMDGAQPILLGLINEQVESKWPRWQFLADPREVDFA